MEKPVVCGAATVSPYVPTVPWNMPIFRWRAAPPIDKKLALSEAQIVQLVRSRRSIRVYDDRPVERETLQRLIDIARYAPTGSNSQMVEWAVIDDRQRLDEICRTTMEWMKKVVAEAPESPFSLYAPPC